MGRIEILTWKFFLEQKAREIGKVVGILLLLSVIPYIVGSVIIFFGGVSPLTSKDVELIFIKWVIGCAGIGAIAIICMMVVNIFRGIKNWIESNWKLAKKRAKAEVQK